MRIARSIRLWFALFSVLYAFIVCNLCFAQSLEGPRTTPPHNNSVLVLFDSTEEYGMYCFEQTLVSLRYARIPFHSYNLGSSNYLPPLEEYTSVLITTETVWKLTPGACQGLSNYVGNGGAVVVLFRGWNANLESLFGIRYSTAPTVIAERSRGLVFTREFLPGINNLSISDRLLTDISRFDVQLDSSVEVFAKTSVGDLPAAWFRRHGRGKVLYWDTSLLTTRIYRGYILASIGCVQPWTSALMLNLSTVCLDDFPLPSSNEKTEPIKSEFNETASEFYSLRWFPDMVKLATQFNIHYTAGLIFNYSEMTKPPYGFIEWSRSQILVAGKPINSSVWDARQASRTVELAFHGHNHQPLTIAKWGTKENMILALQAAKRRWEMDNLGPEPSSYIPPMNIIDSVGLRALVDVFPGVHVIAGQFMGKFELGQKREFGPDPWDQDLIDIPRTTSGYVMDDFNRMMTISMIHSVGVWNHFVHPDDVIPTPGRYQESVREDQNVDAVGWYDEPTKDGLYYRFQVWLQFVAEHYPWLRSLTLNEARDVVKSYSSASTRVTSMRRSVRFVSNLTPAYFMFYLPGRNKVETVDGGEILHKERLAFTNYYVLKSSRAVMELLLKDSVATLTLDGPEQGNIYTTDRSERNEILPPPVSEIVTEALKPRTFVEKVQDLIREGKQLDAIGLLEKLLREDPNNLKLWKEVCQLYDWNSLPEKALKSRENIARLAPDDLEALKSLAQRYVWANRQREAIPLYERILRIDPKDVATAKNLAQNYVWANRQKDAIPLYEKLIRLDPKDIPTMNTLAQNYIWANRQKDAIGLYEKIAKYEPQNLALQRKLGDLYFSNSLNDEGIRHYEQVLKMNKSDTAMVRLLAQKYLELGRQLDALRMYERLLPYESKNIEFRKRMAEVYIWNNFPEKAITQYEAVVATKANDWGTWHTLARMYLENSHLDKAIPVYERIVNNDANDIASLKRLGELYLWKERQKEAVPIFRRIVQAEPDSIPSRLMLGRLYIWTQNPGDAKREFIEVVRRNPKNIEALTLLAEIERSEGDWYAANRHYERVLAMDRQNKEARRGLEDVRTQHGLLFKSSYELTEDSNELVREQVPLAVGTMQGENWRIGANALRQSVFDRRLNLTVIGYGLGMNGQYFVNPNLSVSGAILATSYSTNWVPISVALQVDEVVTSRINSSFKLQRFETTEGVRAISTKIYVNKAAGEFFIQTTDRLSVSGMAEADFYSDDNSKVTAAGFSTYKVFLGAPAVTLLANYAYQNSKIVYASSIPYWTPSRLSTTSLGVDATQDIVEVISIEAAYLYTLQAGVFSSNVRGRITIKPSTFSQILVEYEKLGSTIYSQNTFRVVLQYRY